MKLVFLSLISSLIFTTLLDAREILTDAKAKIFNGNINYAKKQALENVVYQAVKKSVENLIDLKKINKNYGVIKNQIYRFSEKFIVDYKVIHEEKNFDQKYYKIVITAKVNNEKIKEILKELRIINEKKQKKNLLFIYYSEAPNALDPENKAVTVAVESAKETFTNHNFWTFTKNTIKQVYSSIEDEKLVGRPLDSLISLALIFNADILVLMEMTAVQSDVPDGTFYKINTQINFSAFDTMTGQQIAETHVDSYERSTNKLSGIEMEELLIKVAKYSAIENARQSINHIISFYKKLDFFGRDYSLIFIGFSPSQENLIIEYLETNLAYRNLSELKNTLGYLELELFSLKRKSVLRRKIVSELLEDEIEVATKSLAGNRLIFVNPDPMEKEKNSDNSTQLFLKEKFINLSLNKIKVN